MECERLQRLVKNWYAQVQEAAMAPARMVSFMEKHITECQECLADPGIRQEIDKITALLLPPKKVRTPTNNGKNEAEEKAVAQVAQADKANDTEADPLR